MDHSSTRSSGAALAAALLFAGCHATPPGPVRTPIQKPPPLSLGSVVPCGIYGETQGGLTCQFYDKNKKVFLDPADVDPLTRRAYLYDRYFDLYHAPAGEAVERSLGISVPPGDPESHWSDPQYLNGWDDTGDSSLYTAVAGIAAAFRYAATGAGPDLDRLALYTNASLSQFDATGQDGYLARYHFASVPAGTPMQNDLAIGGGQGYPIPPSALAEFPSYYSQGLELDGGVVATQPVWVGGPSIDQYAGPAALYPLSAALLDDPSLKARMARHYACSLKRLKIIKIINISDDPQLQAAVVQYFSTGVVHQQPDEPDLTQIDQIWGFYLPQYNGTTAATYPACPDSLPTDAAPEDTVDVSDPDYVTNLLNVVNKLRGTDPANAVDLVYVPSVRAGDAIMLLSYALAAYDLTGDQSFLDWRDQVLIAKANAPPIARTMGSFELPKECNSFFRDSNVYTAELVGLLLDNNAADRTEAEYVWTNKMRAREMSPLDNIMFDIFYAGEMNTTTPELSGDLAQLLDYGGAPGYLDDPRRNYNVDDSVSPPPGITIATPSAQDIQECEAPVTILGFTIPGQTIDTTALYAETPLPLDDRVTGGFAWEANPFQAVQDWGGAEGHQEYRGLDLTKAYWAARYFKQLPDPGVVLALGPAP